MCEHDETILRASVACGGKGKHANGDGLSSDEKILRCAVEFAATRAYPADRTVHAAQVRRVLVGGSVGVVRMTGWSEGALASPRGAGPRQMQTGVYTAVIPPPHLPTFDAQC